jgi:sortase (surface protein transpeptidase)
LQVDAPLGARAVGEGGTMPLPAGPGDVVMYEFAPQWLSQYGGALGGGAGNVVFAGHLDYQAKVPYAPVNYTGPGVFAGLGQLNPGDTIEVVSAAAGGRTLTYVVEWQRTVTASTDAWVEILGRDVGGEAITLVTCSGSFNLQTLEYDSRVVVRALRRM